MTKRLKFFLALYKEYALCAPPEGKMLGADKNGAPIWIDIPAKTKNELIKDAENTKIELMQNAARIIAPLQDAIDLNIATDEEYKKINRMENLSCAIKSYRYINCA